MRLATSSGLALLLIFFAKTTAIHTQTVTDAAYRTKRAETMQLFNQGQRLAALPMLEELTQANPNDDGVLVALAASLVDRAATLSDQQSAAKERFRARDLLDKALGLGNTSTLALNLSGLLKQLPAEGTLKFSNDPQVQQIMASGESAFVRRDFDAAIQSYMKAAELEPTNYSAALFTANAFDRKNDFSDAADWYRRAIRLDPNVETAYRYDADMSARQGDMETARSMLIQAAVAEPYNPFVWRELRAWATLNHTEIAALVAGISPPGSPAVGAQQTTQLSRAWEAYQTVRNRWQNIGEFARHFPAEKQYRHSLLEESEALTAEAVVLAKFESNSKTAGSVKSDNASVLLERLYRSGLIEPYILFCQGDIGVEHDYEAYRAGNRDKLLEYLDTFLVPKIQQTPARY
jgi:tetratricopeptide (TPR) repeat protein